MMMMMFAQPLQNSLNDTLGLLGDHSHLGLATDWRQLIFDYSNIWIRDVGVKDTRRLF